MMIDYETASVPGGQDEFNYIEERKLTKDAFGIIQMLSADVQVHQELHSVGEKERMAPSTPHHTDGNHHGDNFTSNLTSTNNTLAS